MKTLWILLVDSVRMLRSQKLFWVVLALSGLVALIYASIGIDENGFSAFFGLWSPDMETWIFTAEEAKALYLWIFTDIIVRVWLSFIAVALALISCASIFPEFVAKGSVDLVLSKPPTRLLLFFGKYVGSLLFVFAQVILFCIIVFLAFGLRYGDWNLTVFWAVPIVVFIFSLLYSVHVFVSVWARSVVFGLLAAGLVWGLSILAEWTENVMYKIAYLMPQIGVAMDGTESDAGVQDSAGSGWETGYGIVNGMRTVVPKTRVASDQLRRLIVVKGGQDVAALMSSVDSEEDEASAMERFQRRHPIWIDMVSSGCFEAVFLGLGLFVFCRRDY